MPIIANAEENEDNLKGNSDSETNKDNEMTLSKESETKTDSSIEFKGTYETEEEAQNKKDEK